MKAVKATTVRAQRERRDSGTRHLRYKHMALVAAATLSTMSFSGLANAAGRVFYDGFEDGSTSAWTQDSNRNRCAVVTTAADGKGPAAGSRMARCDNNGSAAWDAANRYETLVHAMPSGASELFVRVRMRLDTNHDRVYQGSCAKKLRWFPSPDLFLVGCNWDGFKFESPDYGVYWGDGAGDTSMTSGGWHTIEYYWGGGKFKYWVDKVLRHSASAGSPPASLLYLQSNWEDSHDTVNYTYFDEIEFFTNTGTGATGLMSDGTIAQGGSQTASSPPAPSGLSATAQ